MHMHMQPAHATCTYATCKCNLQMRCTSDAQAMHMQHAHAMHMQHAQACGPVPSSASTDGTSRERVRVATAEAAAVRRSVTSCASLTWEKEGLASSTLVTRSRNSRHPAPPLTPTPRSLTGARGLTGDFSPSPRVFAVYLPVLPVRVAHREQPSVCRREEQHCPLVRREGPARIGREDCLRLAARMLA